MVKVMIEDDKNKDEITGEFFMGLMLTKEEKTEDSNLKQLHPQLKKGCKKGVIKI